ncbi:MAG TPA: hypothetical protein VFE82_18715 [Ramlibacter sp.]|uniref:hypothetical protein n=1 Tax=Ramlibacter sp. TaxID=1917967 RepID=UPI002D4E11C4|nr:hypothetical protein [Ramlibacter sp.]HZY20509.1 hypothetical protein [Ramlibacter sp.]
MGFLAAARADVPRAKAIFGALVRLRPAGAYCYVGAAMATLNAGRADDAVRVLDRGLAAVGQDDQPQLHAFRALALQLAGRASESRRALGEAGDASLAKGMRGRGTIEPEGN